jgi:hypothetical protein
VICDILSPGMPLDGAPSVFATATVSLTTLAAPGDPFLDLPTQEALVWLAIARGLLLAAVAEVLRITGEQADQLLARARTALNPRPVVD